MSRARLKSRCPLFPLWLYVLQLASKGIRSPTRVIGMLMKSCKCNSAVDADMVQIMAAALENGWREQSDLQIGILTSSCFSPRASQRNPPIRPSRLCSDSESETSESTQQLLRDRNGCGGKLGRPHWMTDIPTEAPGLPSVSRIFEYSLTSW